MKEMRTRWGVVRIHHETLSVAIRLAVVALTVFLSSPNQAIGVCAFIAFFLYPLSLGEGHDLVGVISLVGEQSLGSAIGHQLLGEVAIGDISWAQDEAQRISESVAKGMDFGVKPSTSKTNALGTVFF